MKTYRFGAVALTALMMAGALAGCHRHGPVKVEVVDHDQTVVVHDDKTVVVHANPPGPPPGPDRHDAPQPAQDRHDDRH